MILKTIGAGRRMALLVGFGLLLAACSQSTSTVDLPAADQAGQSQPADYRIVTLLPRDAIPAIDNPEFVSAEEADESYAGDEFVLGVDINGTARAYSVPLLSSHEIVNDFVGGVPIAITW